MAEYEDPATGRMKNDGFNFLELVKHACKSVMFSLNEDDRFSLTVFSTKASVVFPLVSMSEANQALHLADIEMQEPDC
jgi:hypothetical protein